MAGLTLTEVISVFETLTDEYEEESELGLWRIPTDSYEDSGLSDVEEIDPEWWPSLFYEEKASANLREVFVVSDRCDRFFKHSEAAIGSEL